jgi:dihydroorotase
MEFDLATAGTIGLESAFGALLGVLPVDDAVRSLTAGKAVFGIEDRPISEGAQACLSLFETQSDWKFSDSDILSKSRNAALLGHKMKGRAYGIFNDGKLVLR